MIYLLDLKIFLYSVVTLLTIIVPIICTNTEDLEGSKRSFTIDYEADSFLKDGQRFRYVSGSIHYFRSPEQRWDSLLEKFSLAGLNAITTYIAWNLHQPQPKSQFNFDGNLNIFKFLELAQKNKLLVILRPGPYIDAERDMGGLPPWLLWEKPNMKLRSSDLEFNYFVSRWFDELLPRLRPYLYSNGGPIIMAQVENEYGSFGCDKNYTTFLRDLLRFQLGEELLLFSTDGAGDGYVKCGSLPGVYPTVDFGPESYSSVEKSFAVQRNYAPKGPLINSEFYPGWLDHWQKPHSKTNSTEVANALDSMLLLGANVNFYMFHGGTSFGYGAGANIDNNVYDPCPTSYDYDAPLTEAGDPSEKYFAIKNIISNYLTVPKENPVVSEKAAYGKVLLEPVTWIFNDEFLTLFGGSVKSSPSPLSFEEVKVGSGFVLYETVVNFMTTDPVMLNAPGLKDRGYVYINKEFVGILSRSESIYSYSLRTRQGQLLSILVENQGRVCFGNQIGESKGLGGNVTLGAVLLKDWRIYPIGEVDGKKLTKYSQIFQGLVGLEPISGNLGRQGSRIYSQSESFIARSRGSGTIFVGNFSLTAGEDPILDTFIRFDGFSKGMVWINGFNLGRYWPIVGPQETLYLPGPFLNRGSNTVVLLELEGAPDSCLSLTSVKYNDKCYITLTDKHVIDSQTPLNARKIKLYSKS